MSALIRASTVVVNSFPTKQTTGSITRAGAANSVSLPGLLPPATRGGIFLEGQNGPFININTFIKTKEAEDNTKANDPTVVAKVYAILEAVADRVEMHRNIGDQRDNWNTLLLTSINALTLAAAAMTGVASVSVGGAPALTVSSTIMYVAATGLLSLVNKIQPSQLAEEQRNAVRLFRQLQNQIQTVVSIGNPTAADVREMMERVLALDRAFPLPLLGGAMLEKFPARVEPAVWWPENRRNKKNHSGGNRLGYKNGWDGKLEKEMREIVSVIRGKDEEEYLSLGEKALRINKLLAVCGPVLTGLAAVGSALSGSPGEFGGWAAGVGVVGGALASVVNAVEHGGQVGMVVEMYRGNAGFFKWMEETIEWNLREEEPERRENGEVLEVKVGLQLGRSLSELRDMAESYSTNDEHEFASKLF